MKIRFESGTKHPHMQPCFQKLVHWKPIWDKLNLLHASLLCGVLLDKVDQSIGGGVVWSHWTRGLKLWLNRLSQLFAQFHAARKDHRRNNPLITEHGCFTVEFQSTLANNATLQLNQTNVFPLCLGVPEQVHGRVSEHSVIFFPRFPETT